MVERVLAMVQRKDSYIPDRGYRFGHGKFRHLIDRRPGIDYLNIHDTDCVAILKDMIRRAEKNERNDSTSGDN